MSSKPSLQWYTEDDAVELNASGVMSLPEMTEEMVAAFLEGKLLEGSAVRVLFHDDSPGGFSLTHAWFGENYPLPRHTHSADCMYYVVRGELRMGARTIRAGEGLMVPADRPYTYRAGPGGAEVLEFRATSQFDMKILDRDPAKWQEFAAIAKQMAPEWERTRPPWAAAIITAMTQLSEG